MEKIITFKKAVATFEAAARELNSAYSQVDGDTGSRLYPFRESFDDVYRDIKLWNEDVQSNVKTSWGEVRPGGVVIVEYPEKRSLTTLFITRDGEQIECYDNEGNIATIFTPQDLQAMVTGGLDQAKNADVLAYVNHLKHGQFADYFPSLKADATRVFKYHDIQRCSLADLLYNIEHGDEIEELELLQNAELNEVVRVGGFPGSQTFFTRIK